MNQFGAAIQHIRRKRNITQAELAEMSGVSRHTVVNLESDHMANVTLASMESVLKALGMQLAIVPLYRQLVSEKGSSYRVSKADLDNEYFKDEMEYYDAI